MKVEVLGPGCMKCHRQYDEVVEAMKTAGITAEVVKIEKINEIMKRGVMMTPSLIIDGKVVASGKVLSAKDCIPLLKAAIGD